MDCHILYSREFWIPVMLDYSVDLFSLNTDRMEKRCCSRKEYICKKEKDDTDMLFLLVLVCGAEVTP